MTTKRKKAPAKPTSTALVRITPATSDRIIRGVVRRLEDRPAAANAPAMTLTEDAELGALGLVEVKLSEAEEKILSRPVDVGQVLMKPTGQPYLAHTHYTRWLNEAFGRLGWAIVPRAKPAATGVGTGGRVLVTVPYILYIHQVPAAYAIGEQEYWEKNKEQSYGDAVEATVASALRRCMKRLGVGLELWDRRWLDTFVAEHALQVTVEKEGQHVKAWRLLTDKPFWNEVGPGGRRQQAAEREASSSAAPAQRKEPGKEWRASTSTAPISEPQHRRLWVYIQNSGRDDAEVKAWLSRAYGVTLSHKYEKEQTHIARKDYDAIIDAIAADGPLTEPVGKSRA